MPINLKADLNWYCQNLWSKFCLLQHKIFSWSGHVIVETTDLESVPFQPNNFTIYRNVAIFIWYCCRADNVQLMLFSLCCSAYAVQMCCSAYAVQLMLFSLCCSGYVVQRMLFSLCCSAYDVQLMLFSLCCSACAVQLVMFRLCCSDYAVQLMLYNWWCSADTAELMMFTVTVQLILLN